MSSLSEAAEASDAEDDEQAKPDLENGEEFDSSALRTYQLDRLRYYYAVITCSSASVAKAIYDNLDGQEYLTSANFFDLRFVPDGTTFDQDIHDECSKLPDDYKPNDFTTDALTHSKVKLTWDADDATRKEVQKRAFSRKEINENELQAYLGTDSSSSEDEADAAKLDKTASLRKALGLEASSKIGKSDKKDKASVKRDRDFPKPDGEMEITFTGGLSTGSGEGPVFENEIPLQETTMEKYIRKEKERKARRKSKAQAKKMGQDPDAQVDNSDDVRASANEEDPFNDPFFASDPEEATKATKLDQKAKRANKRIEKEKQYKALAAERANLELLMADNDAKTRHFDMNEILQAEKSKWKSKKSKKNAPVAEDNFQINTVDPRFAKLYENHEFAIDPTNPKFKDTAGMKALLEQGRNKRKHHRNGDGSEGEQDFKKSKRQDQDASKDDSLRLAARIKAKSQHK